jgi:hypothetical protein
MRQKVTMYQWRGKEEGRKRFFFEKKKQKTFVTLDRARFNAVGPV